MTTNSHNDFSQGASGADSQLAAPFHGVAGHQPADKTGDSALRASGPASLGVTMPARIFRAFVPLWLRFLEDVARQSLAKVAILVEISGGRFECIARVREDAWEACVRGLKATGAYPSIQVWTTERRQWLDRYLGGWCEGLKGINRSVRDANTKSGWRTIEVM